MHQKIDSLIRIGESKHIAKMEYRSSCEERGAKWNPSKAEGIYSCKTADSYRQTITEFSSWLKENEPDIWKSKNLELVSKQVAYEYLQARDKSLSAWTVSKDMASLNKVLELNLNKKEGNLKSRKISDISRSRNEKEYNKSYNLKNYSDQIEFASAFGLRRESIFGGDYQVKDVSVFKIGSTVYCSVIEKGGKYREAPCLKEFTRIIEEKYQVQERSAFKKEDFIKVYRSSENKLFDKYTNKIDNHALRAKYAQRLYNELIEGAGGVMRELYRGYDKAAILSVSKALGHNRLSVVVDHYMY